MPYPANSGAHLALTLLVGLEFEQSNKQKYKQYGPTLSNSITKPLPELHPNSSHFTNVNWSLLHHKIFQGLYKIIQRGRNEFKFTQQP
jgi:hypothetical protein